jgi:imidazolonepropionase
VPQLVDRLFLRCRELLTLASGPAYGARRGAALGDVGLVKDGAVAVDQGRIVATGPTEQILASFRGRDELDCSGFVVMPGFVDAHTHPVFVAPAPEAFHARLRCPDPREAAAVAPGLEQVVAAVRSASLEELAAATQRHFDGFLWHGTTTIEAKTGYGLSTAAERRCLQALEAAQLGHPLRVHRTFYGAHEVPPEFRHDRAGYVRLLLDEMLPAVAELCDSCDVHAEPTAFDRAQTIAILSAARGAGLRLRMHTDLEAMGGAELGVELGVDSVDHLARISLHGQKLLAESETIGILLPGTTFGLGRNSHAPARALIDLGCAVALATDFNPVTCASQSIPFTMSLAAVLLRMSPEESVHAATINAAAALGLDREIGSLHPGKRADLVALDLPSYTALGYVFGGNPVALTVVGGEPVAAHVREWQPQV